MNIYEKIKEIGIIPVIKLENTEDAVALGRALVNGGIPVAEVTFRAEGAAGVIKAMAEQIPELTVGAGTVLTIEQAEEAIGAGAKFIVSPGFNRKVVEYVLGRGLPMIPGCMTPSEIEQGLELGLDVLKFFPAEANGGMKMIKAMSGPYGGVKFIPTGGINQDNLADYLKSDKILAVGGSWMVKPDLLRNRQFDEVTRLCLEAVEIKEQIR
ncbi:MAG: bifunctional 4-hydroxy-2-oxoglutarate aldolase/2-dehydro-3-deoxy-phosphogluconate aldolase [Bacillota bacterium]|nr:bifunctional 4-hydroxy-2-oxoglutarate aldolase/2-dehydro-3-deoxy-phosphogluconate aldolase [Bacillota bacterium]